MVWLQAGHKHIYFLYWWTYVIADLRLGKEKICVMRGDPVNLLVLHYGMNINTELNLAAWLRMVTFTELNINKLWIFAPQIMLAAVGHDRWSIQREACVQALIRGLLHYANRPLIAFAEVLTSSLHKRATSKAHKTSNSSSHNFWLGGHRDFKSGPQM